MVVCEKLFSFAFLAASGIAGIKLSLHISTFFRSSNTTSLSPASSPPSLLLLNNTGNGTTERSIPETVINDSFFFEQACGNDDKDKANRSCTVSIQRDSDQRQTTHDGADGGNNSKLEDKTNQNVDNGGPRRATTGSESINKRGGGGGDDDRGFGGVPRGPSPRQSDDGRPTKPQVTHERSRPRPAQNKKGGNDHQQRQKQRQEQDQDKENEPTPPLPHEEQGLSFNTDIGIAIVIVVVILAFLNGQYPLRTSNGGQGTLVVNLNDFEELYQFLRSNDGNNVGKASRVPAFSRRGRYHPMRSLNLSKYEKLTVWQLKHLLACFSSDGQVPKPFRYNVPKRRLIYEVAHRYENALRSFLREQVLQLLSIRGQVSAKIRNANKSELIVAAVEAGF